MSPEPGGRSRWRRRGPLLTVALVVAAVALVVLLFTLVFPWLDGLISDPVLGPGSAP